MTTAMNAHKLQVKIFLDAREPLDLEPLIPVFHAWIKHNRLSEVLVDVANYSHVPGGPGVGVVGHASDYFVDQSVHGQGLLYSRKREAPEPSERLEDAFRRALQAAILLEQEAALAGKFRFRTGEFLFRINDRLLAPSDAATFEALKPVIEAFCSKLFGPAAYQLQMNSSPRELFSVRITTTAQTSLPGFLQRLGAKPFGQE
jgi:hypothetical protein